MPKRDRADKDKRKRGSITSFTNQQGETFQGTDAFDELQRRNEALRLKEQPGATAGTQTEIGREVNKQQELNRQRLLTSEFDKSLEARDTLGQLKANKQLGGRQQEIAEQSNQLLTNLEQPANTAPDLTLGEALQSIPSKLRKTNLSGDGTTEPYSIGASVGNIAEDLLTGDFNAAKSGAAKELKNFSKALLALGGIAAVVETGGAAGALLSRSIVRAAPIASKSSTTSLITTIAGATAIYSGVGKATDFNRGKIETRRGAITEIASQGETLRGLVEAGMDPIVALTEAQKMTDALEAYESEIQNIGNYNLEFRASDEHDEINQEIDDAKRNLREAVAQINNIAVSGRATLNEDELLFYMNRLYG